MTSTLTPSFSRSGRSGSNGKQTERISTDVSEALLCDLADAQELFRELKRDEVPGCPDIGGIDRLNQPDPDDSISRLARMHRQGVARDIDGMEVIPDYRCPSCMVYGANLTERDVAARRERADKIADRGLLLAIVGLAVGAGGLIVFVRDLMAAMGVW